LEIKQGGEVLYCENCHKQSPENFINCAYCGEKLNSPKKKAPSKFVKKQGVKLKISLKSILAGLVGFALVLVVAALLTSSFTASKPERIIKNFVKATQTENANMYYALYDDNIKEYKLNNRYFAEDETFKQMVLPMQTSHAFYTEKCGAGYRLSYKVISQRTLSETELKAFNEILETNFSYIQLPSQVEIISVDVVAKGEKGTYTSRYNDFWCMKIKGRWYKVDKNVYTEYLNMEN
jgi:hypothetical protein